MKNQQEQPSHKTPQGINPQTEDLNSGSHLMDLIEQENRQADLLFQKNKQLFRNTTFTPSSSMEFQAKVEQANGQLEIQLKEERKSELRVQDVGAGFESVVTAKSNLKIEILHADQDEQYTIDSHDRNS
ncbi:hypothetical protein FGO68_gene14184 [Halteria grandinella]|uniref:Uncharacterized protein n=1 Tax=Halteria grandinella TaxID=5974 RepID=A0A8J8P3C6_HALGN|nr:hypothetical protein FGO68_gene14184 [Halteria grandinella]